MMGRKTFFNLQGLTLIEVMISFLLLSLLLMTMATSSSFIQKSSQQQMQQLRCEQNIRHGIIAIEKRFQQSNQQRIAYRKDQQLFISELYDEDKDEWYRVFFRFDGYHTTRKNTWLYFHRASGTLRVNLNGEHNVLLSGIGLIETDVLLPDRLVRITVHCKETDYQASTTIKLHWSGEDS